MESTDGRLGGRWSDDCGRCVVEEHDGTMRDGLALGMDSHGRVVVAVKVGKATVVRETVNASAVIMDRERDAKALRAARLRRSADLAAQATTEARSALAAAIASAQALAGQDRRRAQTTARAMAGDV